MKVNKLYICKDNRVRAYITYDSGKTASVSYPRLIMQETLGRELKPYEEIHHIDGNPLNNDVNNLTIINNGEHQRIHMQKYIDKEMICPICGTKFIWTALQQQRFTSHECQRKKAKNPSSKPFCSKSCRAKYSALVTKQAPVAQLV